MVPGPGQQEPEHSEEERFLKSVTHRYHNPVAIRLGAGTVAQLPEILAGRRAVLVTFPEAEGLGLVARLRTILGDSLVAVEDRIEPNPDVSYLAAMYERFWREHARADVVIAVGGGSAIDTAKALMVGTESGRFDDLIALLATGKPFTPARVKALIAVPTTAGTGSEVTPWATIWDKAAGKKHSLHLPQTWPEVAVVDPELMLTLPASVTVQSALDALSHALESIWNVNSNPISDTYAIAAAREVIATLPALLKDPRNVELRARMALAALKAGMAFSNTKTALAHSISYEMTLRFGIPHGIACSFTLPMVLGRAVGVDPGRDAVLGAIFDENLEGAPRRLENFLHEVGVQTDFSAYGVDAEESRRMVMNALDGVRGKNFMGVRT
ncbi:NAD-dependent methanol dehydrogenase [Usitatibacter palustris]|uniref:NAD-dependent methanol dehydrogenase n=1 Tax=Usitatibacter palustris TaxID=2732487 RepID=A0A6M4H7M3_9PROT|nr:NAD-dependent methanol dehydrogenase [Usitatibacter palustris]